MSNQNIVNPKPCNYGCNTSIYWDTVFNSFLEVFSKQKHICKNRNSTSKPSVNNTNRTYLYYNKKPFQQRPKMSNSLELISGSIDSIQKKYEIISDIITEYMGKVHGSQSHVNGSIISLIVYYEIPEGKRDEVKQRFKNSIIVLKNR